MKQTSIWSDAAAATDLMTLQPLKDRVQRKTEKLCDSSFKQTCDTKKVQDKLFSGEAVLVVLHTQPPPHALSNPLVHKVFGLFLYILAQLCNLAAVHLPSPRQQHNISATAEPHWGPLALLRSCQRIIHARGDMSEGGVKREEATHMQTPKILKKLKKKEIIHKLTKTDTTAFFPFLLSPLAFLLSAHTLDILPFFLAGASRGNSGRNPFSTDAGTAVPTLNETQLGLPLSACGSR